MRRAWILLALAAATPAAAASLAIVKSTNVVSDPVNGGVNPRAIPGATIDAAVIVTNPLANLLAPVRTVVLVDAVSSEARFRVRDYGAAGSGPVEFIDGGLLNLGLLNSGLGYSYASLGSATDGIEFSDGTSWAYVPHDDGTGYDPNVRAVRVTLTGMPAAAGSFRLRYRTQLK